MAEFTSSQMDTCHNFSEQYLYHVPHSSMDRQQYAQAILFFG
jgi:hypothetical protein